MARAVDIGQWLAGAHRHLSFDQRMAMALFGLAAMVPLATPALGESYLLLVGERVLIFAIAALSLELLVGVGGLLSFGHAAYLGIGAYAAGICASHGLGTLALALPAALFAAAFFAGVTGAIAVRTRGVYFIMITLAFGQMAFFVATSLAPYGGDDGLSLPGRTLVLGRSLLKSEAVFFYAILLLLAMLYALAHRLIGSRFGRVLRGLTDNEMRMQAIGFAPYPYRLTLFVIAGTACGLAGFLLANQAEFVSPAYLHWQRSGELIIMVLLGGTGTLYGPIIGAFAFLVLEESLSRFTEHWKVILGPLLVVVVLFAKGGIAGAIERWRRGEITLEGLRSAMVAGAMRASNAALGSLRRISAMARQLLAGATPLVQPGLSSIASAWRRCNMALGRVLVALLLLADRRIAGAVARWRRR
jgi:branched-chain amino acid transport system permease protein